MFFLMICSWVGGANLSILFDLDYMTISNFNYNENLDTFNLVISWLFFPAIGYLFTLDGKSKDVLSIEFSPSEVKRALKMAILFFLIQLPEQIYAIITVSSKGYYALYSDFFLLKDISVRQIPFFNIRLDCPY
ncbi:TPA: hypothetical protein OW934_004655 [Escherichia coli]|nr:hypothetical protein [Escherichia coli]HCW2638320.1 hypothetical protein [Escherichia coli]